MWTSTPTASHASEGPHRTPGALAARAPWAPHAAAETLDGRERPQEQPELFRPPTRDTFTLKQGPHRRQHPPSVMDEKDARRFLKDSSREPAPAPAPAPPEGEVEELILGDGKCAVFAAISSQISFLSCRRGWHARIGTRHFSYCINDDIETTTVVIESAY